MTTDDAMPCASDCEGDHFWWTGHPADGEYTKHWCPAPLADWERELLYGDPVSTPEHYRWHPSGVECIEIAGAFDYFLGNVIKYVWRADHKGKPVEDLRKAQTYLAKAIEQREATSSSASDDG